MSAVDCTSTPSVAALEAAGVTAVLRYLSWLPNPKVIGLGEYQRLTGGGIDVVLNWEYDFADWLGGASAGAAHAAEAVRQAGALGYPLGRVIYGSADLDLTSTQWATVAGPYARAFAAGITAGGYLPGVYGSWDTLTWVSDAGYMTRFWQSMSSAYSAGRNARQWPGVHLWQRRTGQVGGVEVDFNDIIRSDYGRGGDGVLSNDEHNLLHVAAWGAQRLWEDADPIVIPPNSATGYPGYSGPNLAKQARDKLAEKLDALATSGTSVDTAAVTAAVQAASQAEQAALADLMGRVTAAGKALTA